MTLPACKLGAAYVEMIHDSLVAQLWPGTDPIQTNEPRDLRLLESAVNSRFQSALGQDIHPSTIEKRAALFRSITANHCFLNGNKRTAVLALDLFLVANEFFLILQNEDMYKLAEKTASYRERGVSHEQALSEILDVIRDETASFQSIEVESKKNERWADLFLRILHMRDQIRSDSLNEIMQH